MGSSVAAILRSRRRRAYCTGRRLSSRPLRMTGFPRACNLLGRWLACEPDARQRQQKSRDLHRPQALAEDQPPLQGSKRWHSSSRAEVRAAPSRRMSVIKRPTAQSEMPAVAQVKESHSSGALSQASVPKASVAAKATPEPRHAAGC